MDTKQACAHLGRRLRELQQAESADAYSALAKELSDLDAAVRERFQESGRAVIAQITGVLRSNALLTPEQLALMKQWVVGDAEAYVAAENNAPDWLAEMQRLGQAIEQVGSGPMDAGVMQQLRGLLRDAIRTAWDLNYYLDSKERIVRFDETTKELDREQRELLMQMLYDKLKSNER